MEWLKGGEKKLCSAPHEIKRQERALPQISHELFQGQENVPIYVLEYFLMK